jgi:hypothetical protein
MSLKSQDIVIVLKLVSIGDRRWSYPMLAEDLFMSASTVHAGVKRAVESGLLDAAKKRPRTKAVEEFLIHGVKYVFPPSRGGPTRGMPTGYAAPPLNLEILQTSEYPPVWPYARGEARGYGFSPLSPSVPKAAEKDFKLYELLALLDAIRGGRAREASIAIEEIKKRLRPGRRAKSASDTIKAILESP